MTVDTIAGYRVVRQLSAGGMGVVYLAARRSTGGFEKQVAIKVMRANLFERPDVRQLFVDEARLVARLTHPNICQVHDFGEEQGQYYLVMEYVDGLRVLDLVRDAARPGQGFPPHLGARILADAARGLHFAHELRGDDGALLGVVHRDISPENIIVTRQGFTKVLDFGIAKWAERVSVTLGDVVRGKPAYMSPEQVHGAPLDRRSDVFALGVVGYELLTARPLFRRASVLATMEAVCDAPITDPCALRPDLPRALGAVLLRTLARDPAARLPSALALTEALEQALAECGQAASSEELAQHLEREVQPRRDATRPARPGLEAATRDGATLATADQTPSPPPERITEPLGPVVVAAQTPDRPATLGSVTAPLPTSPLPRRRRGPGLVAGAALAALLIALGWWSRRADRPASGEPTSAPPTSTLPILAPAQSLDATRIDTLDARPAIVDAAGHERAAYPDRGRPARTGTPRPPRPSAAPAPRDAGPAAAAAVGWLRVAAEPWGQVRVDGVLAGPTPILRLPLAEGEHEVELLAPDSGQVRARQRVQVRAGQRVTVRF